MKDLIGKKMYGFKFSDGIYYSPRMNKHIGKIGNIFYIDERDDEDDVSTSYRVEFENGETWSYPYPQILDHLVEEEKVMESMEEIILTMKQLTSELWKEKI